MTIRQRRRRGGALVLSSVVVTFAAAACGSSGGVASNGVPRADSLDRSTEGPGQDASADPGSSPGCLPPGALTSSFTIDDTSSEDFRISYGGGHLLTTTTSGENHGRYQLYDVATGDTSGPRSLGTTDLPSSPSRTSVTSEGAAILISQADGGDYTVWFVDPSGDVAWAQDVADGGREDSLGVAVFDGRVLVSNAEETLAFTTTDGSATDLPEGVGANENVYHDDDFDPADGTVYLYDRDDDPTAPSSVHVLSGDAVDATIATTDIGLLGLDGSSFAEGPDDTTVLTRLDGTATTFAGGSPIIDDFRQLVTCDDLFYALDESGSLAVGTLATGAQDQGEPPAQSEALAADPDRYLTGDRTQLVLLGSDGDDNAATVDVDVYPLS